MNETTGIPEPGHLTHRQKDVLLLVCEGLCAKEIASRLFITRKTVEFHKLTMCQALGIHSTAQLVRYAVRTGLIQP